MSLKPYVGAKIILAEPMTADDFTNKYGRQVLPSDQNGDGYHVVYSNPEGEYHSWSPLEVFEEAYRQLNQREILFCSANSSPAEERKELNHGTI